MTRYELTPEYAASRRYRRRVSYALVALVVTAFCVLSAFGSLRALHPFDWTPSPGDAERATVAAAAHYRRANARAPGYADQIKEERGAFHTPGHGAIVLPSPEDVGIVGWCALPETPARPCDAVFALVDGRTSVAGHVGESRPDVAAVMKDELLANAGYSVVIRAPQLT
ncbi:MAG: hypothetical protein ABR591_13000, partial [Candidatus Velthaea sp.]